MQLPKVYEPSEYESDIYALWEQSGVFVADPSSKKERFSIAMPPPNETGTLSLGHALFLTLQDIMARYQRMQGREGVKNLLLENPELLAKLNNEVREAMGMDVNPEPAANGTSSNGNGTASANGEPKTKEKAKK